MTCFQGDAEHSDSMKFPIDLADGNLLGKVQLQNFQNHLADDRVDGAAPP